MKSPRWKLANRDLSGGQVTVTREELTRLMEEAARDRVQKGLPVDVGEDISSKLSDYISQLKADLGRVEPTRGQTWGRPSMMPFRRASVGCFHRWPRVETWPISQVCPYQLSTQGQHVSG